METLGSFMTHDHARCDALLHQARQAVGGADWPGARCGIAAFQDALERHLLIEERIIFPAFETAIGSTAGPTAVMRAEHLRIRAVTGRLCNAVGASDGPAFVRHAEALLLVLHQHSEKEDGVLYPMIERVLARTCQDLMREIRALDASIGPGPPEPLEA